VVALNRSPLTAAEILGMSGGVTGRLSLRQQDVLAELPTAQIQHLVREHGLLEEVMGRRRSGKRRVATVLAANRGTAPDEVAESRTL
jgi:hypothetical protein